MKAIIYTTPTCASCHMVEKLLAKQGIEYEKIDISELPELAQDLFEKTGSISVPKTQIGKTIIVGYNPAEIMKLIR